MRGLLAARSTTIERCGACRRPAQSRCPSTKAEHPPKCLNANLRRRFDPRFDRRRHPACWGPFRFGCLIVGQLVPVDLLESPAVMETVDQEAQIGDQPGQGASQYRNAEHITLRIIPVERSLHRSHGSALAADRSTTGARMAREHARQVFLNSAGYGGPPTMQAYAVGTAPFFWHRERPKQEGEKPQVRRALDHCLLIRLVHGVSVKKG